MGPRVEQSASAQSAAARRYSLHSFRGGSNVVHLQLYHNRRCLHPQRQREQQQHSAQHQTHRCVTAHSHQRKRNPFIDIERDVLPDGKPNTPWRRLKLRIQQALSIQTLIKIYLSNRHKTNVWRPKHSAGIIMKIGALQYYRVLQTPVSDEHTSAKTLELLNLLGPDLTQAQVMHILDASRLSQVLVVLSTLHPKPQAAFIDPLVREIMREGGKKLPVTQPDLLAQLAAALVRLDWWERDVWLAVVAAAKSALVAQQQLWQQQQQQLSMLEAAEQGEKGWQSAEEVEEQQGQQMWDEQFWQQQQQQPDLQQQFQHKHQKASQQQQKGVRQVEGHQQQQKQQKRRRRRRRRLLEEQGQWLVEDGDEDDYVKWEQQQSKVFQQQQQDAADAPDWQQQQQQQDQQQLLVEDDQLQGTDQEEWEQQQQQQQGLEAQTEFQWEEQQQTEEQQQWLAKQQWYDPDWQRQLVGEDNDWLEEPWQQQQQGLTGSNTLLAQDSSSSSSRSDLFGPRWLSADFPKLAAALAAVAAQQEQSSSRRNAAESSSSNSSGGSGLSLRHRIEEVMRLLGSAAVRFLVLLTPPELADLAQAYAIIGLVHDELLPGISTALVDKVDYLTSVFSNHRAWQQQPQQQRRQARVADGDRHAVPEEAAATSDLAAIISAAHSLSQLGHANQQLVQAVQKLVLHSTRSSSGGGGGGGGRSVNKLGLAGAVGLGVVQLVQLLELLVSTGCGRDTSVGSLAKFACTSLASSGLDALSPQQLQAAAAALVDLQQQPDAAAAAAVIGAAAAARAKECGPAVLCEVLWGSVMLGCTDQLLAELAVAGVEQTMGPVIKQQHGQPSRKQSKASRSRAQALPSRGVRHSPNMGVDGSTGTELTSKCQAQLVWALQQMNRQDLVDRALAAFHPVKLADHRRPLDPGVPVF